MINFLDYRVKIFEVNQMSGGHLDEITACGHIQITN